MLNHAETVAAALKTFETLNDELSQLYRQCARENAAGYDRPETNAKIDATEKAEHDAWIAYREADRSCDGHVYGPFDPMGVTVYCDGSCRS